MPKYIEPRNIGVGTFRATEKMKRYVNDVLDSGQISYGPYSRDLEYEFSKIHGCKYGILSNSGTSALQVALQALKEFHGWEDGDEVIVPATTFVATSNVVIHNRMVPIFVDVEPVYFGINVEKIEEKITEKTRAIIPVHLFGQACNMAEISVIAKRYGLKVIEDSCETMFVSHAGYPVGSWGDIGCFSFYVAHLLVTGVGGISVTNNPEYAAKMRSIVNHGLMVEQLNPGENFAPRPTPGRRFMFETVGHSFRITELEAALGVAQLDNYWEIVSKRNRNAERLTAYLQVINKKWMNPIQIPEIAPYNSSHAWMMYPIVLNGLDKEPMMNYLNNHGIETRDLMPILIQPSYSYLEFKDFPASTWLINCGFYVGCHQDLDPEDIDYIAQVVDGYFSEKMKVKGNGSDAEREFAEADSSSAGVASRRRSDDLG